MRTLLLVIFLAFLSGCASNPSGRAWLTDDFNKYDKNYAAFPTKQLSVGASKNDVLSLLGSDYELVKSGSGYEVLAYQQWVSAVGPDYVGNTLYLKLQILKSVGQTSPEQHWELTHWKVTSDTVAIVPRSW